VSLRAVSRLVSVSLLSVGACVALANPAGDVPPSLRAAIEKATLLTKETKLTASDATARDFFGFSVAVSGDTAVVGAVVDDPASNDSGSAYVFVRSAGAWTQQQKLTASDAAAGDSFGISVTISGDTAVVGAVSGDSSVTDSGAAYVFVRSGGVWSQHQKLTASDATAFDDFGYSVAVSENTAVVGAPWAGSRSGSSYVYEPASTLLSALSPAKVWVGLKNSDDVGLRLDLLAEVFIDATKVGQGGLDNVGGGGSGFGNALLNTIPLSLTAGPVSAPSGAQLSIKVSARRTCFGAGHNSGTARLWYDGQPVDSGAGRDAGTRFDATIGGTTSDEFLRSGAALSTAAGSSRTSADALVNSSAPCPARPFTSFGTWSSTLP
jgi:FG-GAP repeat